MKLKPFVIAFLAASCLLVGARPVSDIDRASKDEVLDSLTRTLESQAYVPGADFNRIDKLLASQKTQIDNAKTDEEFRQAVAVALERLGYSHVVLFSPQMVEQRLNNAAVGIGIMAMLRDSTLVIHAVFPGTPAEEAGLEPEDAIIEVNGKQPQHVGAMAGAEGTTLLIRVKKFESGEIKTLTLKRRRFNTVLPATLTWADKDTAVLKIPTFDLSYKRKVIEDLVQQAQAAKNLVIDLRGNGGGAVTNMSHLLGLFMPPDMAIGTFISRRLVRDFVNATNGDPGDLVKIAAWAPNKVKPSSNKIPPFAGHLAVLVNGSSGSASEIAAQALKENLKTPIIGEKSAGKVLVSVLAELKRGYQLQYPITDYVSAFGIRLEGNGVTPDVLEKDPRVRRPGKPDGPLDAAVALLHKQEIGQVAAAVGIR